MTEQDFGQFSAVMAALCEYYGKPKLSDMAVGLYFAALLEYPLADVQHGLTAHINNPDSGQFFPKAADVIRALAGSSETRASGAWAKVRQAIERVGHMPSVVFDDAIIHAVIADMGGWVQLSLVTYDELPFRERDFLRFYRSYMGRDLGDYPRKLAGMAETENTAAGHAVAEPQLLGDAQKCLAVMRGGSDKPRLTVQPLSALPQELRGVLNDLRGSNDDFGGAA